MRKASKKDLTEEDIELVVLKYQSGMSGAEVAKHLNFNHNSVATVLRERGVLRKKKFRVKWMDAEHIECSKCSKVKHIDEIVFNVNNSQHKTGSYLSYCKVCRSLQQSESRRGKPLSMDLRAKRLKMRAGDLGVPYDLDGDFLQELYDFQGGLCVYTKEPMVDSQGYGKSPLAISIDKILPNLGYTRGNVVMCTARANSIKYDQTLAEFKEWMPTWHKNLIEHLESRQEATHEHY